MLKLKLILSVLLSLFLLSACSEEKEDTKPENKPIISSGIQLDVYKSPTCGCCGDWVDHVEAAGFETRLHHPVDLMGVKQQQGIGPDYQSCHTAISSNGYVFEGHIPADIMQRFINNPPVNAIGLAVPGMSLGSPGMEMGDHYDDYAVFVLYGDGRSEVYEQIAGKR